MAQKFVEYEVLAKFVADNSFASAEELLQLAEAQAMPIVCGVGLDDISDVTSDRDEEDEPELTLDQKEAALNLYARRFDWVPCHNELREAIDDVRTGRVDRVRHVLHNWRDSQMLITWESDKYQEIVRYEDVFGATVADLAEDDYA